MRRISPKSALAFLALTLSGLTPAHAAFIQTIDGNDCSGVFGQGFEICAVPADPANGIPNPTPIVVKFDFSTDGQVADTSVSSLFPTIDGSEFSFSFTGQGTGTWTYTPGAGDPALLAFVAKGGNAFNLFSTLGDYTNVAFYTPNNASGGPAGLSHMSFYDTGDMQLAEPGTLVLLGLGLLALGFVVRRKLR